MYSVAITVAILVAMCVGFGVSLGPEVLLLVPAVALVVVLASSFALVLSAIHVYFRDVRFLVAAALTVWLYVTPIIFQVDQLPRVLRPFVRFNPMTGVVELFRFATVGASPHWQLSLLVTGAWILVLVVAALQLHRRFDRLFADRI
jgi:ABC-type polysaccharide/polyol phosphate export permease